MNLSRKRWICGACFLFPLLLLCAPASAQSDVPREIQGIIRAAGTNQPIPGAIVTLQSEMGEVIQQSTPEGSGSFRFQYLTKAIYYVSGTAPGYREVRQRADLFMMRRVSVQLFLPAEIRDSQPNPALPPVDQKYLRIPEAARREFEKASTLLKEKKAEESIPLFLKAIAKHKEFPAAFMLLGTAYMDLHNWKDAQPALEKAVQLDEKQAAAHLALGACLAQRGNFAAAEQRLKRGLELNPETPEGQLELGKVYWEQGKWQEAEPHARKALALKTDAAFAHLLLGNILLRKRDGRGALAEFQEYLRLEPQGQFAGSTREVVAKLEKALAGQTP